MARPSNIHERSSGVKKVLFLAPGHEYAKTVVDNLWSLLERNKISCSKTEGRETILVRTDMVLLQVTYIDPVRWTDHMFEGVDAVFGKKELVEKAREYCFHIFIDTPKMSLSKYILGIHSAENDHEVKPRTSYIPEITKVHFNPPMTIVIWDDGTKTTVKCQEGDIFSKETGLALCIAKKSLGNMPNFNNVFKKWIPEEEEVEFETYAKTELDTYEGAARAFSDTLGAAAVELGRDIVECLKKHKFIRKEPQE